MRTRFAPRNFAGGEMAPWLDGISNEMTQKGCRTLENFIVKKQGQATQRPGTFFVNEVKDSSKATALVPVTIDDTNTYVLEIGDAYIRFYKNHARVTYTGTTTIYEVTSPWSTGDLSDLRWTYIPNEKSVRFTCFNGNYPMQTLAWISDNSWTLKKSFITVTKPFVVVDINGKTRLTYDGNNWEFGTIGATSAGIAGGMALGKNNYIQTSFQSTGKDFISEDAILWLGSGLPASVSPNQGNIAGTKYGQIGVVGLASGTIFTSDDDGLTWSTRTVSTAATLYTAIDIDRTHGWWRTAGLNVGAYSLEGMTFLSVADIAGTQNINSLHYGETLWVGGSVDGKIYVATSVAAPWSTSVALTSATYVWDIQSPSINGVTLWLAATGTTGQTGIIFATSNPALAWSSVWTGEAAGTAVWLIRQFANKLFAFTQNNATYGVLESTDGNTWTRVVTVGDPFDNAVAGSIDYADYETFNETNHYPKGTSYNEGRLLIGPTLGSPATIWGSEVDNFIRFYLGDTAETAFSYTLGGQGNVDIQWFIGGMGGVVVGTRTAEGILIGSPEEGITPLTAQFRWLSTFGSSNIQPVRVHDTIVFVQRGGEIIRGYIPQQGAYQSPDLTAFADHIAQGGVLSLYHQDDPQTMVYAVRSDGQLLALTFNGQMIAWSRIVAASTSLSVGIIESAAIIPTTGAEDEMWVIVNRKVAAGTKRYIEYFDTQQVASFADAHYVDCGVEVTSGTTFSTVGSLTHLAGEVVDALLDGSRVLNGLTVAASGTISLLPYSGTHVHAGLPYTAKLQTLRGDYGSQYGDGAGLNKRTSNLIAWVHDSSALAKFGPTSLLATETIAYSTSTALATEICNINFPGQWDRDNYIWCVVRDPRPFTLVAMLPDTETGDR